MGGRPHGPHGWDAAPAAHRALARVPCPRLGIAVRCRHLGLMPGCELLKSRKVAHHMRIAGTLLIAVLAVATISGCKSHMETCSQTNKDYAGAQELPPLTAPAGL